MIANDDENWHYLTVKSLSRLLRGITSNNKGDFYCLIFFFIYIEQKKHLKNMKKVCKDHDYYYVKLPKEDKKISKYNPGEKSSKVPYIVYADLECMFEKLDTCQNDPKKYFAEKS